MSPKSQGSQGSGVRGVQSISQRVEATRGAGPEVLGAACLVGRCGGSWLWRLRETDTVEGHCPVPLGGTSADREAGNAWDPDLQGESTCQLAPPNPAIH